MRFGHTTQPQQPLTLDAVPAADSSFKCAHNQSYSDAASNHAYAMFVLYQPSVATGREEGLYSYFTGTGQWELVAPLAAISPRQWVRYRDSRGVALPFKVSYDGPWDMRAEWLPPDER